MVVKCFKRCFAGLMVIYLHLYGVDCFFVKHVKTGMCIIDTAIRQSGNIKTWGSLSFMELSNNCLDPAAQFRFRDNGAMFNLKRKGCLAADSKPYGLDTFYLYVNGSMYNLEKSACATITRRPITQTSGGALSISYKGYRKSSYQTWCPIPKSDSRLVNIEIDPYIGLTTSCNNDQDTIFNFGSLTCFGNKTENVNCPKDQYMVIKTASYRGLSASKTCDGLSNNYICEIDATCQIKKKCDGQHECNITVDESLFGIHLCAGLSNYLYFEYQCVSKAESLIEQSTHDLCVLDASISHSSLPNAGFLRIITDSGSQRVCWESLNNDNKAKNVVCGQLGYDISNNIVRKDAMADDPDVIFSGTINCNGGEKNLSQCSITTSTESCSEYSYITCHICSPQLLKDKTIIPDSSFTASASTDGHNAVDARISSGSSWCVTNLDNNPYLQVDLGRLYVIYNFAIFGDTTSSKWVTSLKVNFTVDLTKWISFMNQKIFTGNKNAFNDAARHSLSDLKAKALKFIPLEFIGQPCMRVEICGTTLLPDKPTDLTVTKIKSRNIQLSWKVPVNQGDKGVSKYSIKVKKDDAVILSATTSNPTTTKLIESLSPYTKYEVFVAAGNIHGFSENTTTSFTTEEEVPEGPPLNIKVTTESSSSLSVMWDPPEKDKRNGVILNYTVCVSYTTENTPCLKQHITTKMTLTMQGLNASTKYYVRVLASTKVGPGNYSKSEGQTTNANPPKKAGNETETTLTFSLQLPSQNFTHFYIVASKTSDDNLASPNTLNNNDLVTYMEARTNQKPYIAAVITSSGPKESMFILGDGRNTSNPTTRRRRSTTE